MRRALKRRVWLRARDRCEYCRFPSRAALTPFQVDHVIAEQHRGVTSFANLALACYHCNLHKGPNVAGVDPRDRKITRLFNPRTDEWTDHFRWHGPRLVGKTAAARATIVVLKINDPEYVILRQELVEAGLWD